MTRRRKILLFGLCGVIAVVAVCFFCLRDAEPSYDGRTLSEWLVIYGSGADTTESEHAIVAIGPNAVPYLAKLLSAEDEPFVRFLDNHRKIPGALYLVKRARHQTEYGYWGFGIVGKNALPCLKTMLASTDPKIRGRASKAATFIKTLYNIPNE
jgi:hypothetical protein